MGKRGEYILISTACTLGLTLVIGLWVNAGVMLLGLYLALLFLLPPLWWVALYFTQRLYPSSPVLQLFAGALGVQLVGIGLLYAVFPRALSLLDFLTSFCTDWRAGTLLFLPFWVALPLTWWFLKHRSAGSTHRQ